MINPLALSCHCDTMVTMTRRVVREIGPQEALRLLGEAHSAADLFGPRTADREACLTGSPAEADPEAVAFAVARATYRRLARALHPDRCPATDQAQATAAFARLSTLWDEYRSADSTTPRRQAGPGTAQPTGPVVMTTRRRRYTLTGPALTGDLCNLYPANATTAVDTARGASAGAEPVLLKMPRHPRNNDLLAAEAAALTQLHRDGEARHRAYVPTLIETFRYREAGTGIDRRVNALETLDGFATLAEVAAGYPAGVDPRDAAWMWRRLLVALGFAHRAGVVHGAVLPEHVLVHPASHGLVLADWCYASIAGAPVPAIVPRYRDWYPDEVRGKREPSAATDIHLATRTMTTLIGDRMPAPLRAFAAGCTGSSQAGRPGDAWALLRELDELLERLYGPRTFRPFHLPGRGR